MIGKRIKHTKRFQEILNVFFKNGFSHVLFRVGLTKRPPAGLQEDVDMNFRDIGIKLRASLQELGPTFIKLGQIASSRRDMIPQEIIAELEKLQDDVQAIAFEDVRRIVESELGNTLDNLFQSFSETPLATASIGQVHAARLLTGEEVAVKVQRPDIQPTIETDLDIVHHIVRILEERTNWAKAYRIQDMIDEFSYSLRDELDYNTEGRNGERIRKQFTHDANIYVPAVYWSFTTKKVLTMARIEGIKVSHVETLVDEGYDLDIITERLANSMLSQVLEHGYFHGDPHPGNIFILPDHTIAYLDFGMVGRLSKELRYHFASLLIHLHDGNTKGMIQTFSGMGLLEADTDQTALSKDLDRLQDKYYDVPLADVSLAAVMMEVFVIAYRHEIEIPSDIAILGKVILSLEEIVRRLNPDFSIMKAVEPYAKKLMKDRYHPKNIVSQSVEELVDMIRVLSDLPHNIKDVTTMIKKGKLRLDIHVTDLQTVLKRLDRISNRLSFSIILLAFSILMVGLIIGAAISGQTTVLWRLPVIEIGSVIATLMFILMIYTIIRSGRM
ncbi:ABC1 kinase family protein [Lentibacillus saliphilus]|uniref:ABC1 kinase family protein n=1 Tax=Lentibacillus saliphilus TaxID=2737028 RepID=UPI001C300F26|nr:AarF/UbiB family protein [Lentibacillus saliphilus]